MIGLVEFAPDGWPCRNLWPTLDDLGWRRDPGRPSVGEITRGNVVMLVELVTDESDGRMFARVVTEHGGGWLEVFEGELIPCVP